MKQKYLHGFLWSMCLAASIILAGCKQTSAPSLAQEAQTAFDNGDPERARELCDEAMTAEDTQCLSASQLAQLSLIYMKIADKDEHDDGETVGLAVNAYERAIDASPDSALLYYSSVDYDDTRHVKMLLQVVRGLELPDSCLTDEPQTD
ncbi:MAG: hypothetical protein K1V76_06870 [Candidatus Amulumruptor sp.]